jgi:hypothetical protein
MLLLLRRVMPFLTIAILAIAAYDGWYYFSRWNERRIALRLQQEAEAADARRTIALLGGGGLKILNFYASPAVIPAGGRSNICYGVYGAKSVRIEPAVENVYPALSRCLAVSPGKTTEYKLVVEDGAGRSATQALIVGVKR